MSTGLAGMRQAKHLRSASRGGDLSPIERVGGEYLPRNHICCRTGLSRYIVTRICKEARASGRALTWEAFT